jgi:hypothetical protein
VTDKAEKITVQVRYKDVAKTFSGNVNDVWIGINRFFNEFIPAFEISRKVVLTVDLQKLVEHCEKIVAFAPEGPCLLVSRNELTDNETLALQLLASYLGYQLGILKSDDVSKEELQTKLGKSAKIASTRLGELVKGGMVMKTEDGKYRITTLGIVQMQKNVIPKIRAKIGG